MNSLHEAKPNEISSTSADHLKDSSGIGALSSAKH